MSEDNQTVLPASFIALYIEPGRNRPRALREHLSATREHPSATREHISARHEFCEDLASMLTENAQTKLWELGVTEHDVLERMLAGLLAGAPVVSQREAVWVVTRLAELLGWPALTADEPLHRAPDAPLG